jgi:replicative DNA helicase
MAVAGAREEGGPIVFFSLEMSNSELIQRLICSEARISMNDMRRGNIKPHQWEEISRAMGTLNDLPIYLDDLGALTVSDVRSRCRRLKSTVGLAAIFIDYLQLLRPAVLARNANRNEELSEICRSLKATAKDLSVPIIALAQLNRGVEIRSEKRPMLADLRDSGSLEQEADVVAFLYRDGYYNSETPEPDLTEFIIAKHRNGPTGTVKLRFQREYTLFLPYGDESHFPPA